MVLLLEDLLDATFVRRLQERPQQRHDEAADASVDQVLDLGQQILLVERPHDLPPRVDALAHAHDQFLSDQRLGAVDPGDVALVLDRNAVRPLARASDQRRVLKALGDQQAEFGPLRSISRFIASVVE